MGVTESKLEKDFGNDFPEGEHFFGLENYGNTCYCNSILQALYFCIPFRLNLIQYYINNVRDSRFAPDTLLAQTAELFYTIATQRKRCGVLGPKKFLHTLKRENELFQSFMQQDAHEFLNYLLNNIAETLEKETQPNKPKNQSIAGSTFVHKLFEGILTNYTRCEACGTITCKSEAFLDLSLDIEQNTSLTQALSNFTNIEYLRDDDKFYCDNCNSKQNAMKGIKIKHLPRILVLHQKRFKYIKQLQRYKKLMHRVVFPLEFRVESIEEDPTEQEKLYNLFAIVIHVGSGPNSGHYVTIVKSRGRWLLFDDDNIELINERDIHLCFGSTNEMMNQIRRTDCSYILFYQQMSEYNSTEIIDSNTDLSHHATVYNPSATNGHTETNGQQYSAPLKPETEIHNNTRQAEILISKKKAEP